MLIINHSHAIGRFRLLLTSDDFDEHDERTRGRGQHVPSAGTQRDARTDASTIAVTLPSSLRIRPLSLSKGAPSSLGASSQVGVYLNNLIIVAPMQIALSVSYGSTGRGFVTSVLTGKLDGV